MDILFYDRSHEPLVREVKSMCPNVAEYYSMQEVQDAPDIDDILNDLQYDGKEWSVGSG